MNFYNIMIIAALLMDPTTAMSSSRSGKSKSGKGSTTKCNVPTSYSAKSSKSGSNSYGSTKSGKRSKKTGVVVTRSPTAMPSGNGTSVPYDPCSSISPTVSPDDEEGTLNPTLEPSSMPSNSTDPDVRRRSGFPTEAPFEKPTTAPTAFPTFYPSVSPTLSPSISPSLNPSDSPTTSPSNSPSINPSASPTSTPSESPSSGPTTSPSIPPSTSPSVAPSVRPSSSPSVEPSAAPSVSPSSSPSASPSKNPSNSPTTSPTNSPSDNPSTSPTSTPSKSPSSGPTTSPSISPSTSPSVAPSVRPSSSPSVEPSAAPSVSPSSSPSASPSENPSNSPTTSPSTGPSLSPSFSPSVLPSRSPSTSPSASPTKSPSTSPTTSPSSVPSDGPSFNPSSFSSAAPSISITPTTQPTAGECCVDNGFCTGNSNARDIIPLYNFTDQSIDKPVIDGMIGDSPFLPGFGSAFHEYSHLLELPMYNNSQAGGNNRVASAYLGYDCLNNIVCAAANLDQSSVQIERNDDDALIRFGEEFEGFINLRASNADEFAYIMPTGSNSTTGFEGCWSLDTIPRDVVIARSRRSLILGSSGGILNGFVEIFFRVGGNIVSTGSNSNGDSICLTPICEESSDYDDFIA